MANFIYTKAKEAILNGVFNFNENNFKLLFTNENYLPNRDLDQFVSDVNPSSIVFTSNSLLNISNINGVFDADDVSFIIQSNTSFSSIVLFQFQNTNESSRLLAYIDDALGLPFQGSSTSISSTIIWNDLPGKILSI
jgi:hypothetical protein